MRWLAKLVKLPRAAHAGLRCGETDVVGAEMAAEFTTIAVAVA